MRGAERLRFIDVARVTDVHDTGDDVVAVIRSLTDGETILHPPLLAAGIRVERCHDLRLGHHLLRRAPAVDPKPAGG